MKVLWLSMFSMRSYATGKYSILKDGNFQLTLARAIATDFIKIVLAVPSDSSDFEEAVLRVKCLTNRDITLQPMEYGLNAVETRKQFWLSNSQALDKAAQEFDLLISDITDYSGSLPVIYNFNITKLPNLDRPYIDQFFEQDLKSIEHSVFTTVLNPRQREYILQVRPDLNDKVIVNTKCAHRRLLPSHYRPELESNKQIFWPFRLSDKAYKWEEFLKVFCDQRLDLKGYTIQITDPNESVKDLPHFVKKISLTKEEYYQKLSGKPIVVMLDDIDSVLHPGTIEFFYYGCPVITFDCELIQHHNTIDFLYHLDLALSTKFLQYPADDERVKIALNFVYNGPEIDKVYNMDYVLGCLLKNEN